MVLIEHANKQKVVYDYSYDLCGASFIGHTCRNLHQLVEKHKHSVIGGHLKDTHNYNLRLEKIRENLQSHYEMPREARLVNF